MKYTKHKDNATRRQFSDFPLSKQVKFVVGSLLGKVLPEKRKEIATSPFANDSSILDRFIRNGIYATAFKQNNHEQLRKYFSQYWGQDVDSFHQSWADRFQRMFLDQDVYVVNELAKSIESDPSDNKFRHLYEIGCGDGQVIKYLHERFPEFASFTGIDLGAEQIRKNLEANQIDSIAFENADANDWVPANAKPNSVILTNGGVLEYFLQSELEELFSFAAENLTPVAVCIIESVGTDHDLTKEFDSLVYGRELAFSHNYPQLLRAAGFSIVACSERAGESIDGGGRWIRILAVKECSV